MSGPVSGHIGLGVGVAMPLYVKTFRINLLLTCSNLSSSSVRAETESNNSVTIISTDCHLQTNIYNRTFTARNNGGRHGVLGELGPPLLKWPLPAPSAARYIRSILFIRVIAGTGRCDPRMPEIPPASPPGGTICLTVVTTEKKKRSSAYMNYTAQWLCSPVHTHACTQTQGASHHDSLKVFSNVDRKTNFTTIGLYTQNNRTMMNYSGHHKAPKLHSPWWQSHPPAHRRQYLKSQLLLKQQQCLDPSQAEDLRDG